MIGHFQLLWFPAIIPNLVSHAKKALLTSLSLLSGLKGGDLAFLESKI